MEGNDVFEFNEPDNEQHKKRLRKKTKDTSNKRGPLHKRQKKRTRQTIPSRRNNVFAQRKNKRRRDDSADLDSLIRRRQPGTKNKRSHSSLEQHADPRMAKRRRIAYGGGGRGQKKAMQAMMQKLTRTNSQLNQGNSWPPIVPAGMAPLPKQCTIATLRKWCAAHNVDVSDIRGKRKQPYQSRIRLEIKKRKLLNKSKRGNKGNMGRPNLKRSSSMVVSGPPAIRRRTSASDIYATPVRPSHRGGRQRAQDDTILLTLRKEHLGQLENRAMSIREKLDRWHKSWEGPTPKKTLLQKEPPGCMQSPEKTSWG